MTKLRRGLSTWRFMIDGNGVVPDSRCLTSNITGARRSHRRAVVLSCGLGPSEELCNCFIHWFRMSDGTHMAKFVKLQNLDSRQCGS